MNIKHIRIALFAYPIITLIVIMTVLVLQQALYEQEIPTQYRPLPRVEIPTIENVHINSSNQTQANNSLKHTIQTIDELERLGIPHTRLNAIMDEMHLKYEGANVDELIQKANLLNQTPEQQEIANEIYQLINAAIASGNKLGTNYTYVINAAQEINTLANISRQARDAIRLLELTINEQDTTINLTNAKEYQEIATKNYYTEQYEQVFDNVNNAFASIEEARIELSKSKAILKASRRTIYYFFLDNSILIIITATILSIIIFVINNEVQIRILTTKIQQTINEARKMKELMKQAQEAFFNQQLGEHRYKNRIEILKEKRMQTRTEIPILKKRLAKRQKMSIIRIISRK